MINLNELRQLVRLQLLEEASVVDLANRQLGQIAIVLTSNGRKSCLIAVSTSEIVNHEGVPTPVVLGMAEADKEHDGYHRLRRLYADTARTSIVLLAASLEHWERVFPDHSVSPAAQQVIKRYFDQHSDNPNLIELDADVVGRAKQPDFLKAAYLGPVGFDIAAALNAGEKAIANAVDPDNWGPEDVRDMVIDAAFNGFDRAYNDISKTRHTYDDLLRDGGSEDLLNELVKAIQKDGPAKMKALTWLAANEEEVYEMLVTTHPNPLPKWTGIVQPALDKLNYGA